MDRLENGTFRIYHIETSGSQPKDRLIGRFLIDGKQFFILEDHEDLLESALPDGMLDNNHLNTIDKLNHSPYYKIIHENQLNQGHHDHLIEDLDIGPVEPEAEYILSGRNYAPERMEAYGDSILVDGKKLEDQEVQEIMSKVRSGEFKLIPV